MLGRWLSAAGCVVMCSVAVWAGCSSDDKATATGGDDAGGGKDSGSGAQDSGGAESDAENNDAAGQEPSVTIKYGTCPEFKPCGGDVKGKWTVSGGCLSEDTFAAAKQPPCQGLKESDVVIKASGTVEANDTTVQRKTIVSLTAKLGIPQQCAAQAGGNCQFVSAGLTSGIAGFAFDTANCTSDGAGGCNCDVAKKLTENTNDPYTVAGNTLTTTGTSNRTFDYCVAGNKNTFKETTDGGVPIIVEISK